MIRRSRRPRRGLALGLALAASAAAGVVAPAVVRAQTAADVNAEARVYFERGNRQLDQATRTRGERRRALLEQALESYIDSLRVVRSKNAVFNAALTLEQLERWDEAFAYYTEYLSMPGLSDAERAEAGRRRDALRDRVAVVAVSSTPPGATVYVDRPDLAPKGETPLEIAVPAGAHTVIATAPHYQRAKAEVEAAVGERHAVELTLAPEPVTVRIETPPGAGALLVDGAPVTRGSPLTLAPGAHTLRLEVAGAPPVEKEIHVPVGGGPMTVRLAPPPPPVGALRVVSSAPAVVRLDGERVGQGTVVDARASAGTHHLRVEAPGTEPYAADVVVTEGRATVVRVRLAADVPEGKRFGRAPLALGVATGALAAVTLGLAVHARAARNDFDDFRSARCPGDPPACGTGDELAHLRALERDVHRANRAADVFLWTTVAAGATTLVLAVLNREREQPPSRATVSVAPMPGGAVVGARLSFGGPR